MISMIACVDENLGIGFKNDLLVKIPDDLKYFKEKTLGKVIVMGRKTAESLPNKKPLLNRTNILLSKGKDINGFIKYENIDDILEVLNSKYSNEENFIIGGGEVYKQFLKYADRLYITKIYTKFDADVFFPFFEDKFDLVEFTQKTRYNNLEYNFNVYEKKEN